MNNNEELENLEKKREDIKRDFSLAAQDPKRKPNEDLRLFSELAKIDNKIRKLKESGFDSSTCQGSEHKEDKNELKKENSEHGKDPAERTFNEEIQRKINAGRFFSEEIKREIDPFYFSL